MLHRRQQNEFQPTPTMQINKHLLQLVGKTLPVLVEKNNKGHTEYFSAVKIDRDIPAGKIVDMRMEAVEGDYLIGKVAC